jgi:hypothetical protein
MKTGMRITGKELEKFFKKNPTANFWVETGWYDKQLLKSSNGWYYHQNYAFLNDYFSKAVLERLPEIKVYIPPKVIK